MRPAAQRMPSVMSSTVAPHLPATRTGSTRPFQLMPATPVVLFVAAATMPLMMVPCHELGCSGQSPKASGLPVMSACETQSPGSDGSVSRPLLSLAYSTSVTKSWPASTRPARSTCGVMPVSSTATTAVGRPVWRAQAACTLGAPKLGSWPPVVSPAGRSHHWPRSVGET
nr:hypothetical protein [Rhizobacter sp. J219]